MGDSLGGAPLSGPAGRHFPPLRVAAQRPPTARARGGREWRSCLRGPRMAAAGREEAAEGKAERDGGREHGHGPQGARRVLTQPGEAAGGRGEAVEIGGAAARLSSSPAA